MPATTRMMTRVVAFGTAVVRAASNALQSEKYAHALEITAEKPPLAPPMPTPRAAKAQSPSAAKVTPPESPMRNVNQADRTRPTRVQTPVMIATTPMRMSSTTMIALGVAPTRVTAKNRSPANDPATRPAQAPATTPGRVAIHQTPNLPEALYGDPGCARRESLAGGGSSVLGVELSLNETISGFYNRLDSLAGSFEFAPTRTRGDRDTTIRQRTNSTFTTSRSRPCASINANGSSPPNRARRFVGAVAIRALKAVTSPL